MIIEKQQVGEATVYAVCADVRETGGKKPEEIVTLETLERAALVIKYLRGDRMTPEDQREAREIIKEEERNA